MVFRRPRHHNKLSPEIRRQLAWSVRYDPNLVGGGASILSAALSSQRTSGPAPLAITYSAKDSTVTGLTADQVWRNIYCRFEVVGETGASNYATTGLDRYLQTGAPVCAFNLLDPGTYTIRVTATLGTPWATGHYYVADDYVTQGGTTYQCETAHTSGTFATDLAAARWVAVTAASDTEEISVTVTDPDTVFAGTDTVCISTSGNFTGKPTGASEVTGSSTTITSNKRYLYRRGESFSSITVPMGVSNIIIGAYGSGAKPIINRIGSAGSGTLTTWPHTVIVRDINSPKINADTTPYRWTIYNCDIPTDDIDDGIDFGAALNFWNDNHSSPSSLSWPRENHVFECTVTRDAASANLGISGYFNFGGVVANSVDLTYEHSMRIWQTSNAFIAHNAAVGISDADPIRHALKIMSSGNCVVWAPLITDTGGIAWPGTYEGVGGLGSFNVVVADNILGSTLFNNNWIFAAGPQNGDAETVEVFQDFIYERNIHIRPSPPIAWNSDTNLCAKRGTHRFNTVQGGATIEANTTTSAEYNQGAGTGRQVMRDFWCGPYYGQGV